MRKAERDAVPVRARLGFIDLVRALAVILVFLTHAPEVFKPIAGGGDWLFHLTYTINAVLPGRAQLGQ
jgi:peptidoglycan/LPS O-acetylase OafA/YrhL